MGEYNRDEDINGYSKKLSHSDTANGTYVQIGGTFEFDFPGAELGETERTNDDTPNATRDYQPTLYEPGTLPFKYRYGKTQYAEVHEIFLLASSPTTRPQATKYWKIELPDGTIHGPFRGFLKSNKISSMNVEDGVDVEGEIRTLDLLAAPDLDDE